MKKLIITLVFASLIVTGAGWVVWNQTFQQQEDSLPHQLYPVPDFTLMERSGKSIRKADLLGKVWVVDFIFTNCHDTCPLQSARMAQLQKEWKEEQGIKLVSITVDPDRDTPEALRQYAAQFEADPEQWFFLTGTKEQIHDVVVQGFRLAYMPALLMDEVEESHEADEGASMSPVLDILGAWLMPGTAYAHHSALNFMHSARFVLVDQQGDIRGYYESNEAQAMSQLRRHIQLLLTQSIKEET